MEAIKVTNWTDLYYRRLAQEHYPEAPKENWKFEYDEDEDILWACSHNDIDYNLSFCRYYLIAIHGKSTAVLYSSSEFTDPNHVKANCTIESVKENASTYIKIMNQTLNE